MFLAAYFVFVLVLFFVFINDLVEGVIGLCVKFVD